MPPTWLDLFAALRPLEHYVRRTPPPWTPAQCAEVLGLCAAVRAVVPPLIASLDPFPAAHAAWFASLHTRLTTLEQQAQPPPAPPRGL